MARKKNKIKTTVHNPSPKQTQAQSGHNPNPKAPVATPPSQPHGQNPAGNQAPTEQQNYPAGGFWANPNHWIAIASVIMAVSTVAYTYFALQQWGEMQSSNGISRDALQSVQRAFVGFGDSTEARPVVKSPGVLIGWMFSVPIENDGTTPAIDSRQWINKSYGPKFPLDYMFPDMTTGIAHSNILQPKEIKHSSAMSVSPIELIGIETGIAHLYLYGWITYRDVFLGTPLHITMFCREVIEMSGDPFKTNPLMIRYADSPTITVPMINVTESHTGTISRGNLVSSSASLSRRNHCATLTKERPVTPPQA